MGTKKSDFKKGTLCPSNKVVKTYNGHLKANLQEGDLIGRLSLMQALLSRWRCNVPCLCHTRRAEFLVPNIVRRTC